MFDSKIANFIWNFLGLLIALSFVSLIAYGLLDDLKRQHQKDKYTIEIEYQNGDRDTTTLVLSRNPGIPKINQIIILKFNIMSKTKDAVYYCELATQILGDYTPSKEEVALDQRSTDLQEGKIQTYGFHKGVSTWRKYCNVVGTSAYNEKHRFNIGEINTPKKLYDLKQAFINEYISDQFVISKLEHLDK